MPGKAPSLGSLPGAAAKAADRIHRRTDGAEAAPRVPIADQVGAGFRCRAPVSELNGTMPTALIECPHCFDHVTTEGQPGALCSSCGNPLDAQAAPRGPEPGLGGLPVGPGGHPIHPPHASHGVQSPLEEMVEHQVVQPLGFTGIGLAMVGAGIGAALWAAIAYFAQVEIGYVAWGIGGLVGGACTLGGGRGTTMAALCALLTLLSIFAGKFAGMHLLMDGEIDKHLRPMLTQELYQVQMDEALAIAAILPSPSDDRIRSHLVERGLFFEETEITPEDLVEFREWLPQLEKMARERPTFQQWQDQAVAEVATSGTAMEAVKEELSPIDILFALLGITTAFGMVMKASREDGLV